MSALTLCAVALLIASLTLPLSASLGRRLGAVSTPAADRWAISGPIPRFAGPALLLALAPAVDGRKLLALTAFLLVGAVDDLHRLSPAAKALALLPGAALAAWAGGGWEVGVWAFFLANSLNLLDHVDGIAGGAVLGSASAASVVAGTDPQLGPALMGASAAFLRYNLPPARFFLGDGGAYLLGAALALTWTPTTGLLALAGVAVPLADTSFVVVRRLAARRAPWVGGTDHLGHILLRAGAPPLAIPVASAALSGTLPLLLDVVLGA